MNDFAKDALAKLKKPVHGDRYANAMAPAVCAALTSFCNQNGEFAQAVAQGGSMEDCMTAVAAKVKNGSISDLDAYKAAAEFFFPGCIVECSMSIRMSKHETEPAAQAEAPEPFGISLSLEDFLG